MKQSKRTPIALAALTLVAVAMLFLMPTGVTNVVNNTGRPEPVLTGQQWDALTKGSAKPSISAQVTVNNPVPETASESTSRIMRRLASVGPNG